jgi:hypothetical protein
MHLVLAEYRLVWLRVLVLRLAREHPLLLGLLGLRLPLGLVLRLARALPLGHTQKSTRREMLLRVEFVGTVS